MEYVDWQAQLGKALYGGDFDFARFPRQDDGRQGLLGFTEIINPAMTFSAYLQGIFPWFNEDSGEPVLWWSPDPRFVLPVKEFHAPNSLIKFLKHTPYRYTMNAAFSDAIAACAKVKRAGQDGTWIGEKMISVYNELHRRGIAHSLEAWSGEKLAGGFYGVLIGKVFCGESMFTVLPNSSKSALAIFVKAFEKCGGVLIDSQVYTENIARFGGRNISRAAFLRLESELLPQKLDGDLATAFRETAERGASALQN